MVQVSVSKSKSNQNIYILQGQSYHHIDVHLTLLQWAPHHPHISSETRLQTLRLGALLSVHLLSIPNLTVPVSSETLWIFCAIRPHKV